MVSALLLFVGVSLAAAGILLRVRRKQRRAAEREAAELRSRALDDAVREIGNDHFDMYP